MSLILPTWQKLANSYKSDLPSNHSVVESFTSSLHWEISNSLTSNHILAMVALSNTLMSMNLATFSSKYQQYVRYINSQNQLVQLIISNWTPIIAVVQVLMRKKQLLLVCRQILSKAGVNFQLIIVFCFLIKCQQQVVYRERHKN